MSNYYSESEESTDSNSLDRAVGAVAMSGSDAMTGPATPRPGRPRVPEDARIGYLEAPEFVVRKRAALREWAEDRNGDDEDETPRWERPNPRRESRREKARQYWYRKQVKVQWIQERLGLTESEARARLHEME